MKDTKDVEGLIQAMVNEGVSAEEAVDVLLGEGDATPVDLDPDNPKCPKCENALAEAILETQEGEIPGLRCEDCQLDFYPDLEEGEGSEDHEVHEVEIDEDDPTCVVCGSKDLVGEFVEDAGEQVPVLICQGEGCEATYVVAEED